MFKIFEIPAALDVSLCVAMCLNVKFLLPPGPATRPPDRPPAHQHFDLAYHRYHHSTKPRLLSLTVRAQNGKRNKIIHLYLVVLTPVLVALRCYYNFLPSDLYIYII